MYTLPQITLKFPFVAGTGYNFNKITSKTFKLKTNLQDELHCSQTSLAAFIL